MGFCGLMVERADERLALTGGSSDKVLPKTGVFARTDAERVGASMSAGLGEA